MRTPLEESAEALLFQDVPLYGRLPVEMRSRLHGLIRVFVDEKNFEGCGGQKLTDEIRLVIAAQACVLIVSRRDGRIYPGLSSILVYPAAYVVAERTSRAGFIMEEDTVLAGESWTNSAVVLAWDEVRHGARDFRDGHNVVVHEFAHQLDQEDGRADGAPVFDDPQAYADWVRVAGEAFDRLKRDVRRDRRHYLDDYGAQDAAEFFAVAVETFFEDAETMKESEPELYQELVRYFRLDPAEWRS
jgi:Mlc titration factor MtfA (ptsG expression regulator)